MVQLKEYAAIVQLGSVLRNDQSNGESVEKMTAGEVSLGTVFEGRYRGAGTGSARGCAFRSTEELNV